MEHGIFWACSRCGGRALSVELLRRTFTNESINPFWRRVISRAGTAGRDCPCCRRAMLEVLLADTPETSRIDVCPLCHFVWFDASEVNELQPRAPSSVLSPEARRAMALVEIQRIALAAKGHDLDGALLDTWWKKVIRYLDFWVG